MILLTTLQRYPSTRLLCVATASFVPSIACLTTAFGVDFAPTIPNCAPASAKAPEGMVWIPGGEFSMGCMVPTKGVCSMATMNAVDDARPIHRVYVDGFWMDKTDVTNEQFASFVKATGYVHHRRDRADEGGVSHRAAGKSGGRFHGLHAHGAAGAAE